MVHPLLHLWRRIAPILEIVLAIEAALYILLDRSDTLHDLYSAPALIVLVAGAIAVALHLRPRSGGDRRHTGDRRHGERRGHEDDAPSAEHDRSTETSAR